MMPAGDGSFYLCLRAGVRAASNAKVGDRVMVELSFDSTYRRGPTRARGLLDGSWPGNAVHLSRIVENDADGMAMARPDATDPVP
jgi:hypothetical protein